VASYQSHYYVKPTTVAALGYEAASILLQAIADSPDENPATVKAALSQKQFSGLLGPIHFSPQHSACRPVPIMKIEAQKPSIDAILSSCRD
jgi:ABC-type branched-subunit amino acid transport system substrate-binding protein